MRPCPKCGSVGAYALRTRKIFRCKECKHNFSETSGTLWHSPKMTPEKRDKIINSLKEGHNPRQVSIILGIEYKTVWQIAKKIQAKPQWRRVDDRAPRRFSGAKGERDGKSSSS